MNDRPILRERKCLELERFPLFHMTEPQPANPSPTPTATARHDPPTSAQPERHHTARGTRGTNTAFVAEAVRRNPGRTATELHKTLGTLERHEWSRRLADAETLGLICKGPPRPCAVTKRACVTWLYRKD